MLRHKGPIFIAALLTASLLGACGSTSASTGGSGGTTSGSGMKLTTESNSLGVVLALSNGETLYMFTPDSQGASSCSGSCTGVWPPVVAGKVVAGSGVNPGELGSITRADGSKQLTYAGHPLYTYSGDTASGSVSGQGIASFGGSWYVLGVNGTPITKAASTASSSSGNGGY